MYLKYNPTTGKMDWIDPGISVLGDPVTVQHGGTNNTDFNNTGVLFYDSAADKITDDFSNFNYSSGTLTLGSSVTSPTIRGSIASGGNLTLSSTSHATKGQLIFGTSYFDETTGFLGLGMSGATSPSQLTVGINSSHTGIFTNVAQEGTRYLNRNNTVNNWTELLFGNAGGQNSAGIAVQNLSHVTQSGRMHLATGQSGTLTTVVQLTELGNLFTEVVGTTHTTAFQVQGQEGLRLTNRSVTANNWTEIMFRGSGANNFIGGFAAQHVSVTDRNGNMALYLGNGSALTEMWKVVGATGNMGIGVSIPTSRLHVKGDFRVESATSSTLHFKVDNSIQSTFPRTFFQGGNSTSDTNWFMRFADAYSSSSLNIPVGVQLTTNNNTSFTSAYILYLYQSTTQSWITTGYQAAGDGTPLYLGTKGSTFTEPAIFIDTVTNKQRVGIQNTTSPTAWLHIGAGTATAGTAPLKFTSGTLNTTPEAGAIEFLTDDFYATITTGAARKGVVLNDGANLSSGKYPIASTNGRLIDGPTPLAGTKVYYVSDSSGGAVNRKLTFTNGILTSET